MTVKPNCQAEQTVCRDHRCMTSGSQIQLRDGNYRHHDSITENVGLTRRLRVEALPKLADNWRG